MYLCGVPWGEEVEVTLWLSHYVGEIKYVWNSLQYSYQMGRVAVRFRWNLKSLEEGKMGHYWLSESGRASRKKDESKIEENEEKV